MKALLSFSHDFTGEEHQSASVAVEAMDGVGTAALLGVDEIVVQDALRRVFLFGGAVGEQAFFLVDDEQVFVFIDDAQPWAAEAFLGRGLADFDDHAGLKGKVELRGALAIDRNDLIGQHTLDFIAADTVEFLHQEVHQLCRLGYVEFQRIAFGMRGFIFCVFHIRYS